MPARDIYHNTVKNALIKDGWTITHDPLRLREKEAGQTLIEDDIIRLVTFDPTEEVIIRWIH